jgi:hypothetical protein
MTTKARLSNVSIRTRNGVLTCCQAYYVLSIRRSRLPDIDCSDAGGVLRRGLLRAAFSWVVIVSGIAPSQAQQKMSQSDAEYQETPKSGLTCAACSLFRPPRSCEIVQGDISPNGWCRFFDLPD